MNTHNIKEFKALVKRYETISLQEIKKEWGLANGFVHSFDVASKLTGLGGGTCTLCKAVFTCDQCVYNGGDLCTMGINAETYDKMCFAATPTQLKNAFRNRAKHLRKNYSKYLKS